MTTTKLGAVISDQADVNPFQLVLVGAERARQLMRGSRPMIETDANHPTSIVLEEFAAGLLEAEQGEGEPAPPWPTGTESDDETE
jgi:DNA-directed RNA polymerase subunit omega